MAIAFLPHHDATGHRDDGGGRPAAAERRRKGRGRCCATTEARGRMATFRQRCGMSTIPRSKMMHNMTDLAGVTDMA